jgi:RNA polymerase sigma-70 factor (ECF subfamily)
LLSNEEAIMSSFREGNKEAFRTVYDQLVRPLAYFAENILRSQADAEDIVANAFYKLFHARETMRTFEHIRRWLYVTVRNEAIDHLRTRTRIRESRHNMAYLESGVDEQTETEQVRAALLQDLSREIDKLPRQRKTILRLYFFEQKNTTEIAELLQISPQTVLNHKTKALDSLRKNSRRLKWLIEGVPGLILVTCLLLMK